MVNLSGPTNYMIEGNKAAIRNAWSNGFEWDNWEARKSQKFKVENKVLATALVEQHRKTNKRVERN